MVVNVVSYQVQIHLVGLVPRASVAPHSSPIHRILAYIILKSTRCLPRPTRQTASKKLTVPKIAIGELDITPSAVVRVAGAAGAVASVSMAGVVRLALDDDAVAAVVALNEESQKESEEEEDGVPVGD